MRIFPWREVGVIGADQKNRCLWERQRRGSKPRAKVYENLSNFWHEIVLLEFDAAATNSRFIGADNSQGNFPISQHQPTP